MNKLRFEWIVGLVLIASLITLSAVFCRFTLRVAAEMPKESIQQLHQTARQAQQKHLHRENALLLRIERFIVGVQSSLKRKNTAVLKKKQEDKTIPPAHTSNPYQTDPLPFESEEK
ncbi:MAG: hypothetical protein J5601_05575 [Elusimicrobiaceae bacterium]|nr:hypothetical protein [Elusimicrobiaceae bacterium]